MEPGGSRGNSSGQGRKAGGEGRVRGGLLDPEHNVFGSFQVHPVTLDLAPPIRDVSAPKATAKLTAEEGGGHQNTQPPAGNFPQPGLVPWPQ